jgi:pyruvate oxidase
MADQTGSIENNPHTVAELIVEQLRLWGVTRIYGVVGDAILGLMDALAAQDQIQFISVKHESVAAMMASAEAKLTGGLGVCASTMGPGICNLLNGLGDAYMDKAPVLAITGQAPTNKIGTDYKQYLNQQELIKPFAQYSELLASPDAAIDVLVQAMHMSLAKGAVTHLAVPKDMFTMKAKLKLRQKPLVINGSSHFERTELSQAVEVMNSARHPVIFAGLGARKAVREAEVLAAKWESPILVSLGAKGAFPESSPCLLGGIGQGGNPHAPEISKQADVVLLAGDTWWPEGYVPANARIIQIDLVHENIGKGIPVEIGIVGDTAAVLPLLTEGLREPGERSDWTIKWKQAKEAWQQENEAEGSKFGTPIHPSRIVRAIENAVQDDAVIALDTGDSTVWFNRNFRPQQQEVVFSGDWRTMGFGMPAAMAAKLCRPDKQVIAVVGDGGLGMVLADLLTAVRYRIKITVVVFSNGYLQMERDKMIVGGHLQKGIFVTNPDFNKLAEACGWDGFKVKEDEMLEGVLHNALSSNRPALVEVMTAPVVHPQTK